MKLVQEFKEFALKGNVVDLAVGVIVGAAFGAVVSSFVTNVMMPPLGWLVSGVDFEELSLDIPVGRLEAAVAVGAAEDASASARAAETPAEVEAAAAEVQAAAPTPTAAPDPVTGTVGTGADQVVRIMYGRFLNDVIKFVIQAFAIFLVITGMNRLRRQKAAAVDTPGTSEPTLTTEEKLLTEIRDLLSARPQP